MNLSEHFEYLPTELKVHILEFVNEPGLTASVSTSWQGLTEEVFRGIFKTYENYPSLAQYTEKVTNLNSPHDKVKAVYTSLVAKAKVLGVEKKDLFHIEEMADEVQQRQREGLISFFEKLNIPEVKSFLSGISNLSSDDKFGAIKKWMDDNKPLLSQIKHISLPYSKLDFIPEEISYFSNLEELDLNNNKITSLPESIGELKKLRVLSLSDNQITSLPESIGELKGVTILVLSNNQITSLPESIGELEKLMMLFLTNNSLSSLPESIGELEKLIQIDLRKNPLSSLPKTFVNIKSRIKIDNKSLIKDLG